MTTPSKEAEKCWLPDDGLDGLFSCRRRVCMMVEKPNLKIVDLNSLVLGRSLFDLSLLMA